MKKILGLIVLVVVVAYFGCSFYASKKLDDFFTLNNGKLFDRFGLTWQVTSSKKGLFSSKYESKITFILPSQTLELANFTHDAKFGFNFSSIGSMKTIGKIDIDLDSIEDLSPSDIENIKELGIKTKKDFDFDSSLTFGGIQTDLDFSAANKTISEDILVSYSDLKYKNFISYSQDKILHEDNTPSLKIIISDNVFLDINDYKESSTFTKDNGFWFGSSNANGKKLYINLFDEIKYNLEDFNGSASIVRQDSKLFKFVNKLSSKNAGVEYNDTVMINGSVKDVVYNESIENLDIESFSSLFSTISKLNFGYSEVTAGLELLTLADKALRILEKQPKYAINEISAVYDDERQSASAFIQYVGDPSKINNIMNSSGTDFLGGFELNIGEKLFNKVLNYYANKETEYEFGNIYSLWEIDEDTMNKYLADSNVTDILDLSYEQEKEIIRLENEKRKELSKDSFDSTVKRIADERKDKLKELNIEVKDSRLKVNFNYNKGNIFLNEKSIDEGNMPYLF